MSMIAKCPSCDFEWIYKGKAIRPKVVCSKCKKLFYIPTQKDTHDTPKRGRKKKTKSIIDIISETPKYKFTAINDKVIETILLDKINSGKCDISIVRCTMDYYTKVKGVEEGIEGDIDLELFLKHGKAIQAGN